ncbi:MAG: hypothetical protein KatS3mg082_3325 [Nitrospiraceae bacterium]|nr:MAG: hypothetical protein KatS3mg082_3325 [Nitrospiraceae bacterium]
MAAKAYTLKALTDIWTGDAKGKPDRTIATGLLGSIRWWFEVLVRGLGGSACDPTRDGNHCPDHRKKPTDPGHHCVVCEFFGCTGWARKFRFEVLDQSGKTKAAQIKKDDVLQFRFTALRPVCKQEWALLDLTLRLIAEYGAIGGKTVYKPSDEPGLADLDMSDFEQSNGDVCVRRSRKGLPLQKDDILLEVGRKSISSLQDLRDACNGRFHGEPVSVNLKRGSDTAEIEAWFGKRHHVDYGVIQVVETSPSLLPSDRKQLDSYILQERWRKSKHDDFAWASVANFWCVKGKYLARQEPNASSFNKAIGRRESKGQSQRLSANDDVNRWLAGSQQRSKKIFSFKEPPQARRTFGFVKPGTVDFNEISRRLKTVWTGFEDQEFLEGNTILGQLLPGSSGGGL